MKAIIYHSMSKDLRSKKIALEFEGDHFEIKALKPIKSFFFQLVVYGFKTVSKSPVAIKPLDIDFSKYDDIVLISPIYAGRINCFMRDFLKENIFHDKKVTIIGSSDGEKNPKYFSSFKPFIDGCNDIVDTIHYVKGIKQA